MSSRGLYKAIAWRRSGRGRGRWSETGRVKKQRWPSKAYSRERRGEQPMSGETWKKRSSYSFTRAVWGLLIEMCASAPEVLQCNRDRAHAEG